MNYADMVRAVEDARRTVELADSQTGSMVRLIKGRLRGMGATYTNIELLKALKKELSQFNAVTGQWKN